jgi:carboxylesterase
MTTNKIISGCEPIYLEGNHIGCLLLHGFTSSPFEMRLLGAHLQKKKYTIHIPLLPGHGISPKNLKSCLWYDWYNCAKNELFQLRKKCNKVFVVGLSMGGTLALHLTSHYEVDGVAALAPGLYLKNKLAPLAHFLYPLLPYKQNFSGSDISTNEKTLTYNKIPLKSISELLKLFKHLENDLHDIYAPAMIIYSKSDHVIHSKSAIRIYDKISSKDKRILELKNSYHILTLDIEKEKVFNEVANFIKRLVK